MSTDAFTLNSIARELDNAVSGGKITKIHQPESDEITLQIYSKNNYKLLISCNPSLPRIHLTSYSKENPLTAPSFCMLLRKYITSATIERVYLHGCERQIIIQLIAKNEMFDDVTRLLIVELMGKHSNIILTDENNKILAVNKQITFDISSVRQLMAGLKYEQPPAQDKLPYTDISAIESLLKEYQGLSIKNFLTEKVCGMSAQTIGEILFRSKINENATKLTASEVISIISIFKEFLTATKQPCVLLGDDEKPLDFFLFNYLGISNNYVQFDSVNEAGDNYYFLKDKYKRFNEHSKHLQAIVKNELKKCEKKLGIYLNKKLDCADCDQLKKYGELIISNLYRIKNSEESVILEDFYDNMKPIVVKLDKRLSPQQNAQKYFKQYTKKKTTLSLVGGQIAEIESDISYLISVLEAFRKCSETNEIDEIRQELIKSKIIKQDNNKKQQTTVKKTQYLTYFYKDYNIIVGKNNIQNDEITFKIGRANDIWLHTKNIHGSHVLIQNPTGQTVPDYILQFSAELAAYYSKGYQDSKVEVDYTQKKYVTKPSGAKAGFVIFTDQSTVLVKPNQHIESKKG